MIRGLLVSLLGMAIGYSQSYPPAAGQPGSTAIAANSPQFVAWATGIAVVRGPVNISDPEMSAGGSTFASAGQPEFAMGYPDGNTVSLGDGGSAVLTFAQPIKDGTGFDFAVFENGSTAYLELAFVEASSDGLHFFRFESHSQTQTDTQLGTFGTPSAHYLNNLAGKYEGPYGTPFDLSELPDDPLLDKQNVTHIKIVDAVGAINPAYAQYDHFGNAVNESFPTPFTSCGFDLQAVGVIHWQVLDLETFGFRDLKIYPNPVADHLFLQGADDVGIAVFDGSGKLLLVQNSVEESIDVSRLAAGIYLLELRSDDQKKTVRLIKK